MTRDRRPLQFFFPGGVLMKLEGWTFLSWSWVKAIIPFLWMHTFRTSLKLPRNKGIAKVGMTIMVGCSPGGVPAVMLVAMWRRTKK